MADRRRMVTIKDVAEAAGVSRSTTSRALTGNGYVAPEVRERVQTAAKRLGYVPDIVARSLKQQRSTLIGVLVSDLRNPFYADLAAGVSSRARERGFEVILSDQSARDYSAAASAKSFAALRVAGVIATPMTEATVTELLRFHLPVVEVDRLFHPDRVDSVVTANRRGAREAVDALIAAGHRRIALIIDETEWTTGLERREGYRQALTEAGIDEDPAFELEVGWDAEEARRVTTRLLSDPHPPTAIFAANNVLAEGAWNAVHDLDLSIPEDLSLVAFDDVSWMRMVRPAITVVAQDAFGMGVEAANRLLARLDTPDAPSSQVVLGTRFISRGSIASPRSSHRAL